MTSIHQPPTAKTDAQEAQSALRRDFVASIAAPDPELNLIRRIYKGLNGEKAVELFAMKSMAMCSIGHDYIKAHISEEETATAVTTFLRSERDGSAQLLKSLGSFRLPPLPELQETLLNISFTSKPVLAELASKVICFRYPELIPTLVANMNLGIRLGLCFSRDESLIPALIASWGRDHVVKSPPVAMGLLMTPQALSKIWASDAELALSMARAYGYRDDAEDAPDPALHDQLREYLSVGLMLTDPAFLSFSPEELQERETRLIRSLLPWSTGMNRPMPEGFSLKERLDQLLFISAVRTAEKANFDVKMDEKPHTERGMENLSWLEFGFSTVSYSRRNLISAPLKAFSDLQANPDFFAQYVIEYANSRLERDGMLRDEQQLFLESRWAHAALKGIRPETVHGFPVTDGSTHLEVSELVLPARPRIFTSRMEQLSLGASSTRKLLIYTGNESLLDTLGAVERNARDILPSVGIEIQIPFPAQRSSQSFSWKQALRAFDIPSPRRPEYRSLVEAAFMPAFSYNAHVASLLMLRKLDLFQPGADLALHVSLSGKLGTDVRYLLFAQQFAAAPTNSPPGRKLMSKGFAHLHQDAVDPVYRDKPAKDPHRTELRSMRINMEELLSERFPHFVDDIITFHLLGGALASTHPALQKIWTSFAEAIRATTRELPAEFGILLDADWYESTGDSSDPALMPLLDIVSKRQRAGQWIKEQGKADELRQQFRDIRNQHARKVFEVLPKPAVLSSSPDHFAFSASGIPFLNPLWAAS